MHAQTRTILQFPGTREWVLSSVPVCLAANLPGARVSAVWRDRDRFIAYYDGRATVAENYEERTGIAAGPGPAALTALGAAPVAESPHVGRGLRYLDILELAGARRRLNYEMARPDGAHELRTELR